MRPLLLPFLYFAVPGAVAAMPQVQLPPGQLYPHPKFCPGRTCGKVQDAERKRGCRKGCKRLARRPPESADNRYGLSFLAISIHSLATFSVVERVFVVAGPMAAQGSGPCGVGLREIDDMINILVERREEMEAESFLAQVTEDKTIIHSATIYSRDLRKGFT